MVKLAFITSVVGGNSGYDLAQVYKIIVRTCRVDNEFIFN